MVECLRREWLYSEKRARDFVFTAVDGVIQEQSPAMLSHLARETARTARRLAEDAGVPFDHWNTVTKAVIKSMVLAQSLLAADDTPIALDVGTQAATVGGLRPDYRDATEAYLIEFLIGRMGNVTPRDHTALAHALFRQFDPNISRDSLEDRVVILLARLSDRVVLSGDAYQLLPDART
jgi:hypothetical protein